MITRNILDYQGNIIGTLDFLDGTSEEDIAKKLAKYAQPPVEEIQGVTPRQIREALILSGVSLSDIDSFIDTLPEPTKSIARVNWEYSTMFKRNNQLINTYAGSIGFNSTALDNLWKLAATR